MGWIECEKGRERDIESRSTQRASAFCERTSAAERERERDAPEAAMNLTKLKLVSQEAGKKNKQKKKQVLQPPESSRGRRQRIAHPTPGSIDVFLLEEPPHSFTLQPFV